MAIKTDNISSSPSPDERLVATQSSPEENVLERALRPKQLDEYVGQKKARGQLEIFISAAKQRNEALDHVLLFGPPGLGKTTLAHIIAKEMGVNLRQTSGPVLERPGDLAALLTNLEANDVLFTVTASYTHRPDLLAYDLYQNSSLWWVFAQRNPSVLKDPIYDLEPGVQIYLPKLSSMKQVMGI